MAVTHDLAIVNYKESAKYGASLKYSNVITAAACNIFTEFSSECIVDMT